MTKKRRRITIADTHILSQRKSGVWGWLKSLFGHPRTRLQVGLEVFTVGPPRKDGSCKVYATRYWCLDGYGCRHEFKPLSKDSRDEPA